jgi:ribonuclease PH
MIPPRADGRSPDELREIQIEPGWQPSPEGSALIAWGETRVLCSASIENRVPPFVTTRGSGWITAEYDMVPGSGNRRIRRDRGGQVKGRSQEIQRLVGRSLRQCVMLDKLGDRTITIDCDVLVADGGTRVAAITGGAVALRLAIRRLLSTGQLEIDPWRGYVAAVSMGLVDGAPMLDLCYEEDSRAQVDMNLVCSGAGTLVELQASAEQGSFDLDSVADLFRTGLQTVLREVIPVQRLCVGE